MFSRWVVLTVKTGRKVETVKKVQQDILPILEKCNGFFGAIPLEPIDEPLKVYVMSLWEDRRDAEKYERESFAAVTHILEPFLAAPISVKHGTIDEAISKKLVTTVAAWRQPQNFDKGPNLNHTEAIYVCSFPGNDHQTGEEN